MTPPRSLRTEFLCTMRIHVVDSHIIEGIPGGTRRRIDLLGEGSVTGPRLNGTVLPGGIDALLTRNDGSLRPDVRLVVKTHDGSLIFVQYRGVRHGKPEIMDRIAAGENINSTEYYLRNAPFFEASSGPYEWLNHIVSVGVGRREPDSAVYDIYEIL